MNDVNPLTEEPFEASRQQAQELAPRMVAWNTALTATWAYLVLGEFVVARWLPEVIAFGLLFAASFFAFLVSEQRYRDYLLDHSPKPRLLTLLRALWIFVLLILLAILLGTVIPEAFVPTVMLLVCGGLVIYRVRAKRRVFEKSTHAPNLLWVAIVIASIVVVTMASVGSAWGE